ncbi:MAG TPA: hypothetical protein VGM29_11255 [Polyangiaceae bacterium]|jgi:hypothetical protein
MNKAIDALSVLLLLGAAVAFWLGIIALGAHRDAVAIYWLIVGGLVLYSSTELLRPRSGSR